MRVLKVASIPPRLLLGTSKLAFRSGYAAGRTVGFSRLLIFGAGVATGLLVAPITGRELRKRLRDRMEQSGPVPDHELDERVRFELSHSPRTWHLPQPEVEVISGRVVLTGRVPHETGRQDLERAAAAVRGVAGIDNRMEISGTTAAG